MYLYLIICTCVISWANVLIAYVCIFMQNEKKKIYWEKSIPMIALQWLSHIADGASFSNFMCTLNIELHKSLMKLKYF